MIRWALYKRVSPRFGYLVGCFYGDLDYAVALVERACGRHRKGYKRRHTEAYRCFFAAGQPPAFCPGW